MKKSLDSSSNANNHEENKLAFDKFALKLAHLKAESFDLARQRPLLCSLSRQEKQLHIWNYERNLVELNRKMDESVLLDAKIHPNGSILCVLCSDKICFYTIVLNDLKLESSFKLPQPCQIQFSNSGSLIGVLCASSSINIYSVWSHELLLELKLKIGKIQHFVWINDGHNLACCSNSGIICIWNSFTGQKICEYIEKSVQFTRLSYFIDKKDSAMCKFYLCALDKANKTMRILSCPCDKSGHLSEPSTPNNSDLMFHMFHNVFDMKLENVIDLERFRSSLFVIVRNYLISIDWKQNEESDASLIFVYDFFNEHCREVECLKLDRKIDKLFSLETETNFDLLCLTNSHELTLFKSANRQNSSSILKLNDIIISKTDMKKNLLSYDLILKQNLIDEASEQNYQLRLKDMLYKEQIKQINYESKVNVSFLRQILKESKLSNDETKRENRQKLDLIQKQIAKNLEQLRQSFESKLYEMHLSYDKMSEMLSDKEALNEALKLRIENLKQRPKTVKKNKQTNALKRSLSSESNSNLYSMSKLFDCLKSENDSYLNRSDQMLASFSTYKKSNLDRLREEMQLLEMNRCVLRHKIFALKSSIGKFRLEKESKYLDESFLFELKKKNALLNESCDLLEKNVRLSGEEAQNHGQKLANIRKKIELLHKKKAVNELELAGAEARVKSIEAQNESLKSEILKLEECLFALKLKKKRILNMIK